jgi:hypothetical protein
MRLPISSLPTNQPPSGTQVSNRIPQMPKVYHPIAAHLSAQTIWKNIAITATRRPSESLRTTNNSPHTPRAIPRHTRFDVGTRCAERLCERPTTRITHRRLVASRLVASKQLPPTWPRGCFPTRPSPPFFRKPPRLFLLHLNSVPPIGSEEWCPSVHGTHVGKQPSADTNELSSRPNSNHEECGV